MLAALLLAMACSAPGFAASPQQSPSAAQRRGMELQAELSTLREELEAMLSELEGLRGGYQRGFTAAAPEREGLRKRIAEKRERFALIVSEFAEFRAQGLLTGLRQVLDGDGRQDLGGKIAYTIAVDNAWKHNRGFPADVERLLSEDAAIFANAQEAARKRRIFVLLVGSLLTAAFIFGLRAFRSRGGADSPVSLPAYSAPITLPGPARAAISAPAGGRALLDGPADNLAPGALIGGNFEVLRELGRGGMGLVYEAMDRTLQRKVAVKKMRGELRASPKELENFLAEARLVAALKHPHIVEIHGVEQEDGQVFLIFEFVAGRTLSSLLEERERLPLREVSALLTPVGAALDYAHERKVIHRDLKPANVMVTGDGGVKVMDFGLAHQAKMTVARSTRAEAWGTPAYMAPEQELGTVSRESDLYALGVCLYEMARGQIPFPGPNFLAQKRELLYLAPSSAGLPAALDAVVAKALQPDPARRFHSAAELLAALAALGE